VEDALLGLVTKSANDAAVVVAENIGGSIPAFAARMNRTARALGMTNTTFNNPNGLPDPDQHTTARDLARLADTPGIA
jgi:D-alanyl-D-alanine carboxypeptidase